MSADAPVSTGRRRTRLAVKRRDHPLYQRFTRSCPVSVLTDNANPTSPTEQVVHQGSSPEVSVVLPSYNHSRYIARAIDSVLAQTLRSWELIVIDDGSTDDSRSVLEQYGGREQIRIVYQSNQGAHHAINRGMGMATGRYISILNSDDVYHSERLQVLLDHCKARSDGLAFTPVLPIDAGGDPITDPDHPWCRLYARLSRAYSEEGFSQALLTGNFAVSTSNFFFRADLLARVGGFRKKRYNHDWDFMARLVSQGYEITCAGDQPLLFYRWHGNNTIHQNTLMARVELKRILQGLVPANDPYVASLVSHITRNLRSVRREHEARLVQTLLTELATVTQHRQTLSTELAAVTRDRQALSAELEAMSQDRLRVLRQLELAQDHLALIQGSRSYRLSQHLARVASYFRRGRSGSRN